MQIEWGNFAYLEILDKYGKTVRSIRLTTTRNYLPIGFEFPIKLSCGVIAFFAKSFTIYLAMKCKIHCLKK